MTYRLGRFEEIVLMTIARVGPDAYGMTIRQELAERTGKGVSVGAVYTTLERLERKGYVSSRLGEATSERGGRAKRFFRVEYLGDRALNASLETLFRMMPDGDADQTDWRDTTNAAEETNR